MKPTPTKNKKETKVRIPRPKGTTYLIHNNEQKETIRRHVIKHYIDNNYLLNGAPASVTDVANYLDINATYIQQLINRYLKVQGRGYTNDDKDGTNMAKTAELARGVIFQALKKSQQASEIAGLQAAQLFQEQGGKYVPFLSSATNHAISNALSAHKGLLELAQALQPKQPTISILNNNQVAQSTHLTLGPSEAQKMVEEYTSQVGIGTPQHLQILAQNQDQSSWPDITSNVMAEKILEEGFMGKKAPKNKAATSISEAEIIEE